MWEVILIPVLVNAVTKLIETIIKKIDGKKEDKEKDAD